MSSVNEVRGKKARKEIDGIEGASGRQTHEHGQPRIDAERLERHVKRLARIEGELRQ